MAKRPIFEEVSDPNASRPVARTGLIDAAPKGARRAIRLWLIVLFALVVAMIALGGATRLTGSGLSITEWAPVTGTLPPMDDTTWQREFQAYQQIRNFRRSIPTWTWRGSSVSTGGNGRIGCWAG